MKVKPYVTFFFIAILGTTGLFMTAYAQNANLAQTNIRYVYDKNAPVTLDKQVAMGKNEATVFLKVTVKESSGNQAPGINYEVRSDYKQGNLLNKGNLNNEHLIKQEANVYFYRFTVPVEETSHYVFVYIHTDAQETAPPFRFDIPLETDTSFPLTDLITMREEEDIPIFKNYIDRNEPFRLVSWYERFPKAYIYFYKHEFAPNPPPMAVRGAETQQNISIDSLFTASVDSLLNFSDIGLYFVQKDTSSLSGISFRICDSYYPRLVTAEDLIDPLRYISTSEEIEQLEESEDKKAALDKYWIKLTRSQEKARSLIRNYYRQVTEANRLFTTYKEGWKTGQGMVFVLFGIPDQVFREDQQEVWVYHAGRDLVDMTFTFLKVKNIYTDEHYNLVPDEDYKRFWFRNIDLWRRGRKTLQ